MRAQVTGAGSRRTAIAAAVILTALAAGCSASPPATPQQAIKLAASNAGTVTSFTAKVSIHATTTAGTAGSQSFTLAGTVTERVRPSLLARVDYTTFKAAGTSMPSGISEIITARDIYIRLAVLGKLLHTGKPWVGLSASALSASSGLDLSSLFSQLKTSSPLSQARLLTGAKDVTTVGTGTVAGVPVTEYSGTYSMAAALRKLPASLRASLRKAFTQAGVASAAVRFKVWIDGKHLVRKEIATITSSKLRETVTSTVTSVNQPVTITPPPASQVYMVSPPQLGSAA